MQHPVCHTLVRRALGAFGFAGLALLGLLVTAGGAFATDADAPPADVAAQTAAAAPTYTHQMRAHIDPETGGLTLRPVPMKLSEALQNALSRSDQGLVPVTLPNGTQLLHLQGRFQTLSLFQVGEAGADLLCTHDAAAVQTVLTATHLPNAPADR